MTHPLQYELETARHLDYHRGAEHQRLIAEAEHLTPGPGSSTACLRITAEGIRRTISRALRVEVLRHAAD